MASRFFGCAVNLAMAILVLVHPARIFSQQTGMGRSFVLTVPYVSPSSFYTLPDIRLIVASTTGADVSVVYSLNGAAQSFTVLPGSFFELLLDTALVML